MSRRRRLCAKHRILCSECKKRAVITEKSLTIYFCTNCRKRKCGGGAHGRGCGIVIAQIYARGEAQEGRWDRPEYAPGSYPGLCISCTERVAIEKRVTDHSPLVVHKILSPKPPSPKSRPLITIKGKSHEGQPRGLFYLNLHDF